MSQVFGGLITAVRGTTVDPIPKVTSLIRMLGTMTTTPIVQLLKRMTESELEQNMQSENKTLILENFSTVVRLLGVWIKQSKIELNTL